MNDKLTKKAGKEVWSSDSLMTLENSCLFYVFDRKYKKFAGIRGEKGRTFDQYSREKIFKKSGLMFMDIEGIVIDDSGGLYLNDECGNSMVLPADRFQVCLPKEVFNNL